MKIHRFLILTLSVFFLSSCCHHLKIPKLDYNTLFSFTAFSSKLKTGDIILFHGDTRFDQITDFFECSPWAHVGMIIKSEGHQTYIWESTIKSNVRDVDYYKTKGGPQLVLLKDRLINDVRIKDHSGWAIRKLHVSESVRNTFDDALKHIVKVEHEKDIPGAIEVFVESVLGRFFEIETNEKKVFCSELIILTFIQMGLVSKEEIANGYTPKDFSSDSDKLKFVNKEVGLSNELYFKPLLTNDVLKIRTASNINF